MTHHAGSEIKLRETKIRMNRVGILRKKLTSHDNYVCKLQMLTLFTKHYYCC